MSYIERVEQLQQAAMTSTPMPQYQCHKKVWALKIKSVEIIRPTIDELQKLLDGGDVPDVAAVITPEEPRFGAFGVSKAYVDKHQPQAGGYYVVYSDGYQSYSPSEAFESGYTRIT